MSLTNLLRNKSRVFVLGAALTACGDNYYQIDGSGAGGSNDAYTCGAAADKLVYCGVIEAPKDVLSDCRKGLSVMKEATEEDIACIIESPCEYLTNYKTESCKR